jgi:hypothetical protein
MFEGRGGLTVLRELKGNLVPQIGVVGPKLDNFDQLGARLVALVGCLEIVGQGLMNLDRIRGLLELLVSPLDQLREPPGACQNADGGNATRVGVVGIVNVGIALAHGRGRTEDLQGDLHGGVQLALTLILEHHADQGRCLVAGASAGATQHRLGQLVLTKLVHLARKTYLGVGVEP